MHKSATKCNETIGKWCKNKHGASKIMYTLETYQCTPMRASDSGTERCPQKCMRDPNAAAVLTGIGRHGSGGDVRQKEPSSGMESVESVSFGSSVSGYISEFSLRK
jgi:hypothetical protein